MTDPVEGNMTKSKKLRWVLGIVAFIMAVWADGNPLWAGSATEQVKTAVGRVVEILKNPRVQGDARKRERREQLRQAIYQCFDFAEMAKRSLGNHWQRNAARRGEFVPAFARFVEDAYVSRIEGYKNEKILYTRERLDEGFAEVDTRVVTAKGDEIPINYRLHSVEGQWKVYDVLIEHVSLVNNYRSQFHRIIATASFDELLKKLKERALEPKGTKS